ncbi:MAG: hypothetical protein ACRCTS_07230 [Fusobacteriaceae bacterium]
MSSFLKKREVFRGEPAKKINEYKPIADYEKLELEEEEVKSLIECEKNIIFHQQKTKEHLMSISETLFQAQRILANHNGGTFRMWFEDLGLKKDFVYMCLKRYNLYLHYEKDSVMELPEKVIKEITKEKSEVEFQESDILKIIEAEKPNEVLKEIKNSFMETGKNIVHSLEVDGYETVEVLPSREEELRNKKIILKDINKEIRDLEKRLRELKKDKNSLEESLQGLENEKIIIEI